MSAPFKRVVLSSQTTLQIFVRHLSTISNEGQFSSYFFSYFVFCLEFCFEVVIWGGDGKEPSTEFKIELGYFFLAKFHLGKVNEQHLLFLTICMNSAVMDLFHT